MQMRQLLGVEPEAVMVGTGFCATGQTPIAGVIAGALGVGAVSSAFWGAIRAANKQVVAAREATAKQVEAMASREPAARRYGSGANILVVVRVKKADGKFVSTISRCTLGGSTAAASQRRHCRNGRPDQLLHPRQSNRRRGQHEIPSDMSGE